MITNKDNFVTRFIPLLLFFIFLAFTGVSGQNKHSGRPIGIFDLKYTLNYNLKDSSQVLKLWDDIHALSTLQGVVNRSGPFLYLNYIKTGSREIDTYWWNKYRKPGEWLSGFDTVVYSGIVNVIKAYSPFIKGAVLYDSKVASTSNVASAVAGVEDLIAVRYDPAPGSLYSRIILGGPRLKVIVRLINADGTPMFTGKGNIPGTDRISTGSIKNDPYIWFIENYVKKGKCNTKFAAYYIDQKWRDNPGATEPNHHTLSNHDFFVSKKAFFFDLSPWGDEPATDDLSQKTGTDLSTLKEFLLLAYKQNEGKQFCYIGGFPAWAFKYTTHAGGKHEDVPTEWEFSRIISAFNAFKDADAIGYGALANSSFWTHFPLRETYDQKWVTKEDLKRRGYLTADGRVDLKNRNFMIFYVGDYDASSWISQRTPDIWDHPDRGKLPLMWCISPVLQERVPMVLHNFRMTATANDYFAAADNGAGYLMPGMLQAPRDVSGLPDGLDAWAEHCKKYYQKWGLTISGFIIDGHAPALTEKGLDCYESFSPDGIVPQKVAKTLLHNNMPVLRSDEDIMQDPKEAAKRIVSRVKSRQIPFHWFRNILKSPGWYVSVVNEIHKLDPGIELLDAPTFFELYRMWLKENPDAAAGLDVTMQVANPEISWRPPFGTDRVGRSFDVNLVFRTKGIPRGDFYLAALSGGKETGRGKINFSENDSDPFTFNHVSKPGENEEIFSGSPLFTGFFDQLVLLHSGPQQPLHEIARTPVKLSSLEIEATVEPDEIINPVDLGTILVPADWLLITGGEKAIVKIAALSRQEALTVHAKVWYSSAVNNFTDKDIYLVPGKTSIQEIESPAGNTKLKNDILNISVLDNNGREIWKKAVNVMIVSDKLALPAFGAVNAKLRYDSPILNIVDKKNEPLSYDSLWPGKFNDVIVSFPNGSRFVFWRGTSYIPVWAGKYNTCMSYEWAERISPNDGFTDCPEPLMDKELRYSNVEIVESTPARVHVRWKYQSCDFNYKVNGDIPVEDYYFYPDGMGTRVLSLRSIPEAEYEVAEFIVLAPGAMFPLSFLPSSPADIISLVSREKKTIRLPETDRSWRDSPDPSIYRIRIHKDEPLSAISFNPLLFKKPNAFRPVYDKGVQVTPAYWGGHWPLSRGFNTMWSVNESILTGPSHNSLMTWGPQRPDPVKTRTEESEDANGTKKLMRSETWVWLIGMTAADDQDLLKMADSFAGPAVLELTGAREDDEKYSVERKAFCLVATEKRVIVNIKPVKWSVNPVFEIKEAAGKVQTVKVDGKSLDDQEYAWDGKVLWLKGSFNKPVKLEIKFK